MDTEAALIRPDIVLCFSQRRNIVYLETLQILVELVEDQRIVFYAVRDQPDFGVP